MFAHLRGVYRRVAMKYLAIMGFVGAASCILTNFPGSANARDGDFRKQYGEPVVQWWCGYVGGVWAAWGCRKIIVNTSNPYKARKYPTQQPAQQPTQQAAAGPGVIAPPRLTRSLPPPPPIPQRPRLRVRL